MTKTRTLKRWGVGGAVALLAAMTFMAMAAQAASAQETDLATDSQLRFRTVEAVGSGVAALRGRYVQEGAIGAGALIVSASADVRLDGFDQRIALGDGHVLYLGARGRYRIAGDDISSTLIGAHITFEAAGAGSAHFTGDGSFSINSRPRQPWN